jgi:uncharacterized protein with PQ loop repeat
VTHHKHLHPRRFLRGSRFENFLIYFFSITTPLFMLPQVYEIFHNHSAVNVALATWVYFVLADLVWMGYGIKHHIMPLIVCHLLYLFIESVIVVGILFYS